MCFCSSTNLSWSTGYLRISFEKQRCCRQSAHNWKSLTCTAFHLQQNLMANRTCADHRGKTAIEHCSWFSWPLKQIPFFWCSRHPGWSTNTSERMGQSCLQYGSYNSTCLWGSRWALRHKVRFIQKTNCSQECCVDRTPHKCTNWEEQPQHCQTMRAEKAVRFHWFGRSSTKGPSSLIRQKP